MTTEEFVIRFDARLASVARNGRTAVVCFLVRGQDDDLARLQRAGDSEMILGLVIVRELATSNGTSTE